MVVIALVLASPVHPLAAESDEKPNCDQLAQIRTDADHKNPEAEMQLSKLYFSGKCVDQDLHEGAKWIDRAAEQGYSPAQGRLALILYEGKQYDEAARWATRAAGSGDNWGEIVLARLYYLGKGVPQNDAEAFKWAHRAANHDNGVGQALLAEMYNDGEGVPKDDIEADKWYILAGRTESANTWLIVARTKIELGMSKKDIAEAERRAYSWKPNSEHQQ